MKKLFALILVLSFLCPFSAFAEREYLLDHYTMYFDGNFYNTYRNGTIEFDTLSYDLYILADLSSAYLLKQEWKDGVLDSSGIVKTRYKKHPGGFDLVFEDGSTLSGKWDTSSDDIFIELSGHYFRFTPVHHFDVSTDLDPEQ